MRVGMLTSGGDCQSLNATMRGVAKSLYRMYGEDVEIIGFEDGYKGLIYAARFRHLKNLKEKNPRINTGFSSLFVSKTCCMESLAGNFFDFFI